jgi:hypothetical protein
VSRKKGKLCNCRTTVLTPLREVDRSLPKFLGAEDLLTSMKASTPPFPTTPLTFPLDVEVTLSFVKGKSTKMIYKIESAHVPPPPGTWPKAGQGGAFIYME